MAGHLPIATTRKHLRLIKEFRTNEKLQKAPLFERVRVEGINGYFQRLPEAYDMFEETGKEDTHIFFFCGNENKDEYFEVHLNEEFKVNQVYLVM
jgi:uncharacterized protein YxeA